MKPHSRWINMPPLWAHLTLITSQSSHSKNCHHIKLPPPSLSPQRLSFNLDFDGDIESLTLHPPIINIPHTKLYLWKTTTLIILFESTSVPQINSSAKAKHFQSLEHKMLIKIFSHKCFFKTSDLVASQLLEETHRKRMDGK